MPEIALSNDDGKGRIEHMSSPGELNNEWGEFFPASLSPFAYNETVAQEYFPLTKEEVTKLGTKWENIDPKQYQKQTYVIPDEIKDVSDLVVNEILACEECFKNYKIISQELAFYRKMGFPVPHKCPDCRHLGRMKLRNPRKLWERDCAKCRSGIQTTYSTDRSEVVYCDSCYLAEVA